MDKKKIIIIALVVAVLVAVAYFMFFKKSDDNTDTPKTDTGTSNASVSNSTSSGVTSSSNGGTSFVENIVNKAKTNLETLQAQVGKKCYLTNTDAANGEQLYAEGIGSVTLLKDNSSKSKTKMTVTGDAKQPWVVGTIDKVTGSYVRVGLNKWVRKGDYAGHLYVRR